MVAHTERIAASLEPELRRVIDVTMARVAEIEQATRREAQGLLETSEEDSHETLARSQRLVSRLEVLTGTVAEVTSTLRTEVDDVTEALRELRQSPVRLPAAEIPRHSDGSPPQDLPAAPTPTPASSSDADMAEMYRHHITRMRDDGKSRREARRIMRRYTMGHRFMWMVDDIYMYDGSAEQPRSSGGPLKRLFTRG